MYLQPYKVKSHHSNEYGKFALLLTSQVTLMKFSIVTDARC